MNYVFFLLIPVCIVYEISQVLTLNKLKQSLELLRKCKVVQGLFLRKEVSSMRRNKNQDLSLSHLQREWKLPVAYLQALMILRTLWQSSRPIQNGQTQSTMKKI